MSKDFKLDKLNKVMTVEFSTIEEKKELERMIKEMKTGKVIEKSFELLSIAGSMESELSDEINQELMDFLALEAYSQIYGNKDLKDPNVLINYIQNVDYAELIVEIIHKGKFDTQKVSEELVDQCEFTGIEDQLMMSLNLEETDQFVGQCDGDVIKTKSIETGVSVELESGEFVSGELIKLLEYSKKYRFEEIEEVYFFQSFLDPALFENVLDFEILDLPVLSFSLEAKGKLENGYNKLQSFLLVRLEENLEKITFWHKKDIDFTKEIEYVEEVIKKNLKKILLKSKFI